MQPATALKSGEAASSKGPAAKKNFFQDFSRQLAMAKRQNSIVGILSSGQKAKA